MITLITGLPGSGKTLYTLSYVESIKENRTVFYNGIPELTLSWQLTDKPEDWHKLPSGSIVVIDECQRVFRPRGNGGAVPEHVAQLETHRHSGIDLILITQHPMLVDSNVRRLVGRHFHVVRQFGMQRSIIHEWASVKEQCDKSRADSVKHVFGYPKESFNWYKSAEVHTHKRRIPARLLFLLAAPVVITALFYYGITWQQRRHEEKQATPAKGEVGTPAPVNQSPSAPPQKKTRIEMVADYLSDRAPLLAGFPNTAPAYKEVTRPRQAPAPVACIQSDKRPCKCYTQQATVIHDMPSETCSQIVAAGYFVDWEGQQGMTQDRGTGSALGATGSPVMVSRGDRTGTAINPQTDPDHKR